MRITVLLLGLIGSTSVFASTCNPVVDFKRVDRSTMTDSVTFTKSINIKNNVRFLIANQKEFEYKTDCLFLNGAKKRCDTDKEYLGVKFQGIYHSFGPAHNLGGMRFKLSDNRLVKMSETGLESEYKIALPTFSGFSISSSIILNNSKTETLKSPNNPDIEYQITVNRVCK